MPSSGPRPPQRPTPRIPAPRAPAPRGSQPRPAAPPSTDARADLAGFTGSLRLSGFTLLVLGLVVLAVLILAPGLKTYFEQQQEIADLRAQVEYQQQQVEELGEQRDRWSDPVYVRSQVRERLYFVMPGEISYIVVGAEDVVEETEEVADTLQSTDVDWGAQLLGSFMVAGLGDPDPEELGGSSPLDDSAQDDSTRSTGGD